VLLSDALPIAERLVEVLREHPASDAVDVAGSARRLAETCKDIDLIATASDGVALATALIEHPLAAASGNPSANGARITTYNGVKVDLRIVPPEEYGNLLQHFTGSAAHNIQLRERAVKMGLSVSEHGIMDTETGRVARHKTEAAVYKRLGLRYIEPELREGRGEINAAADGKLPKLIELGDIRGDLHSHTTLSDGKNTLEEMALAAKAKGYAYFAVTDHSATHGFGDHVTPERLEERIEEIAELNAEIGSSRFRVLAGTESNILPDGTLDYEDALLERLDWVVASVHTSFRMTRANMTARLVAAVEHPLVDCLGHPSGRMLLRREGYDFDIEAVAEAAARSGTMIEINGNPNRRDLSEQNARVVADAGVKICLNTDAHRVATLDNMRYGVATARRAWLTKADVANARPWGQFQKLRKR
jgi:DNA polymerase (family X)